MAGFVGGERFTILVGMEAPRWVGEAVQQGLLALEDLTDAERCNNFATREAAAQAGGRVMLADDRRSWRLSPDGRWQRVEVLESREGTVETFAVLKEDAATAAARADVPRRPHAQAGSMDPRA